MRFTPNNDLKNDHFMPIVDGTKSLNSTYTTDLVRRSLVLTNHPIIIVTQAVSLHGMVNFQIVTNTHQLVIMHIQFSLRILMAKNTLTKVH